MLLCFKTPIIGWDYLSAGLQCFSSLFSPSIPLTVSAHCAKFFVLTPPCSLPPGTGRVHPHDNTLGQDLFDFSRQLKFKFALTDSRASLAFGHKGGGALSQLTAAWNAA